MWYNNINKIHTHTSNSGPSSTGNSETTVSIKIHRNNKKIWKIRGRGKRGKELRNNICNKTGFLRGCTPRTIQLTNRLNYHRRISRIIGEINFGNSTSWEPNDLTCAVCNTPFTSKMQIVQHFKSKKQEWEIWNCTPKYCAPCGIFHEFSIEQLWTAHISSRSYKSAISKLPYFKRRLSEYGFTN